MQPVGLKWPMSSNLLVFSNPDLPLTLIDIFKSGEDWDLTTFGQALYDKTYTKIVVLVPTAGEALMLPGQLNTLHWYIKEYLPGRLTQNGQIHYLHFHDIYSIIKSTDG